MILLLVFVVAPIVELYVAIKTGQAIGVLNTLALMILIALVGSWLIKREGLKVFNRFATQVQAGQVPSKEIADGVCLLLAGALMIAPGFVSDGVALLLLFPPTRVIFRSWLLRRKGMSGFGSRTIIRASYGGRMPNQTDIFHGGDSITDTTSTEARGEIPRRDGSGSSGSGTTWNEGETER